MFTSCFTMAVNDFSGKKEPVSDEAKTVLLPAAVAADVVTSPVQILAVGGYAAGKVLIPSKKSNDMIPTYQPEVTVPKTKKKSE